MYVGIIGTVHTHMHAWYNTHTALLTAAMTGTYLRMVLCADVECCA